MVAHAACKCDIAASKCDIAASKCDNGASKCDNTASKCDITPFKCDNAVSEWGDAAFKCTDKSPLPLLLPPPGAYRTASGPTQGATRCARLPWAGSLLPLRGAR